MGDQIATKQKLIEGALELFAKNGYSASSMRDLARATGMTISATYYYFGSKYGLLLAVLEHLSDELRAELERVSKMDLEPLERFKELIKAHLARLALDRNKASLFFLDEEALTPAANEINKQFQLSFLNAYREQLRTLQEAGYLRSDNITVLAFNTIGIIQWHFRWYRVEGKLSLDEVTEEAVSYILHGILKEGIEVSPPGTQVRVADSGSDLLLAKKRRATRAGKRASRSKSR
jgi:TetR/AcrR family transcriptional regulator, cholesterol catabolism regulator